MRVLVVGLNYAPEPTGIAPYTASLCRGLVERGHDVWVVTTMPHYPEWRVRNGYRGAGLREQVSGVRVQRVRHYVPSKPQGMRRLLSELSFGMHAVLAGWERPDVAVFVSPALFASAIGQAKARLLGVPSVVWVQDVYTLGVVEAAGSASGGLLARTIERVESRVLRRAGGVCVIHDRFADVARNLGVSRGALRVVRNWTHLPSPVPAPRSRVRSELGWGEDLSVALHSGAMGKKQDLDNVLAAARIAAAEDLPVRFVLMGNGGERARLEAAAGGLPTLQFVDPLPGDRYQDALAAADVLIVNEHPGLREMALPSKLTSYFSSGRPVVAATDRDSVTASEVEASGAGLRVEPGDPHALLQAVLDLRADPGRGTALGRAGLQYRESVLSEHAAIDQFENWLLSVAAVRPSATRLAFGEG